MSDFQIYLFYSNLRKKYGDDVLFYIYLTLDRYMKFMEVKNEKRS